MTNFVLPSYLCCMMFGIQKVQMTYVIPHYRDGIGIHGTIIVNYHKNTYGSYDDQIYNYIYRYTSFRSILSKSNVELKDSNSKII